MYFCGLDFLCAGVDNVCMQKYFDAHCHLQNASRVADVMARAADAGVMLSGKSRNARITFQVIGNGILKFIFRGPDERANGARFPVWVDYSSIKIDGTEILSAPIQTWHNQPYVFEKNVTDGQIVTMECVQIPHNYTDTELETLINNLSQTPYFIDADIAVLRKYYSNTN